MISGIVGLDLSMTSTGIARWGIMPEIPVMFHGVLTTDKRSGSTDIERCISIASQIHLLSMKADIYFIEDYAYGVTPKISRLATLGELGGIVKLVMMKHTKCEPFVVAPGTWKKFLCGKGNLDKASFKLEVYKKLGIEPKGHDDAAAIAICDFARCMLKPGAAGRELKKYELDVIKSYREKHPELRIRLQSLAKYHASLSES